MDLQLLLKIAGLIITAIGVTITAIKARKDIKHIIGRIRYKTGLQIDRISKIPGKRRSRAELVDTANTIQQLAYDIEDALRGQHTLITKINNEIGNPITQDLLNEKGKRIEHVKETREKLGSKVQSIKSRNWKGTETYYSKEKPRKRI